MFEAHLLDLENDRCVYMTSFIQTPYGIEWQHKVNFEFWLSIMQSGCQNNTIWSLLKDVVKIIVRIYQSQENGIVFNSLQLSSTLVTIAYNYMQSLSAGGAHRHVFIEQPFLYQCRFIALESRTQRLKCWMMRRQWEKGAQAGSEALLDASFNHAAIGAKICSIFII